MHNTEPMTKTCKCCGESKPLTEYHKQRVSKDGHHAVCKACTSVQRAARHLAYKEKYNALSREYYASHPDWARWLSLKGRAKKQGWVFTLEVEDVVAPEFCPVLGVKLIRGKGVGRKQPCSPSVHRIDSTKGYTKDNIRIMSEAAAHLLRTPTASRLTALATWILEQQPITKS